MNTRWNKMTLVGAVGLLSVMLALGAGCDRAELDPEAATGTPTESGGDSFHHHFSMDVQGLDASPGETQTGTIEIEPGTDLEINLEFPWSLEINDVEGVEIDDHQIAQEQMELNKERARIPFDYSAAEEGEYTVTATGDFSVCNDEVCHFARGEDIEFVVDAGMQAE